MHPFSPLSFPEGKAQKKNLKYSQQLKQKQKKRQENRKSKAQKHSGRVYMEKWYWEKALSREIKYKNLQWGDLAPQST
jgi:hypothetical protein